jgi:hypothetical protein
MHPPTPTLRQRPDICFERADTSETMSDCGNGDVKGAKQSTYGETARGSRSELLIGPREHLNLSDIN